MEPLRLATPGLEVHEQDASGRGRHRRALGLALLERAHRGAQRVLRQGDGDDQHEDPDGHRGAEPPFGVDDAGGQADDGGDRHDHGQDPRRPRSGQGDPRRRKEHDDQDEPRQHPQRFVRPDGERGDDDAEDEQDRHDGRDAAAGRGRCASGSHGGYPSGTASRAWPRFGPQIAGHPFLSSPARRGARCDVRGHRARRTATNCPICHCGTSRRRTRQEGADLAPRPQSVSRPYSSCSGVGFELPRESIGLTDVGHHDEECRDHGFLLRRCASR